eukprot:gnl/MRDRNA2_/MRDRNA2_116981_c0_seq1.p1 gnl/MRDRNA2_/MRDRNA2_116981_c0~~gnl/MRDRNA2_/MRDRNA2_116981_c0_seq1.p1  ORF type:complete len:201 (+),score=36.65 gnl/MRDRNA2_/MRDRNA2_116981_c0_seq1:296-898(+)
MSQPGFYDEPNIAKIFYINLDGSSWRRRHMESILTQAQQQNPNITVERWRATDKKEAEAITRELLHEFTELGLGDSAEMGTQAVYYSHYSLVKHISEQKDPSAVFIILEDDVDFSADTLLEVSCQLKMLPPDWDVYRFGYVGYRIFGSKSGYPSKKNGNTQNALTLDIASTSTLAMKQTGIGTIWAIRLMLYDHRGQQEC